jgi:hypothetical protein
MQRFAVRAFSPEEMKLFVDRYSEVFVTQPSFEPDLLDLLGRQVEKAVRTVGGTG